MGQPVIQTSFNAGEWAPALNARTDLAKYHSGAALLRNFFVDYRGGATTRPGTRYVIQARNTSFRLIPFTASFTVTYMLEFGPGYIRFLNNGAPVLEVATTITSAAAGPPEVFSDAAHGYANNDWLFIADSYYIVQNATTNTFTLTDLFGNAINTNPFTLPTSAQRVYTLLNSPYQASDLPLIKFCQNVNQLYLTHPNHPPYVLQLNSATSWTLNAISFAPTIASPTISSSSTAGFPSGTQSVAYAATAVDINGQESAPVFQGFSSLEFEGIDGTVVINVTAVTGAQSYNLYRSQYDLTNSAVPSSVPFGFIGNFIGTRLYDTNTVPDFSQGIPLIQNPFSGSGVQNTTVTAAGANYTSVPIVAYTTAPLGGVTAQGAASMTVVAPGSITTAGQGFVAGQGANVIGPGQGAIGVLVTSVNGSGGITGFTAFTVGVFTSGSLPINIQLASPFGASFNAAVNLIWGVQSVLTNNPGEGYITAPAISFSGGGGSGAAATATLGTASSGNPTAPALIQQRLFLGGPVLSPGQFNLSQPGSPFNYNVSFPTADDDAIQETLTSTTLHTIKSAVAVSAGLVVFSDKAAWLVNGGTAGSAIGATNIVANPQGYSGANDVPPILTPNDILYVQAKGSVVRDLAYNFYLNNYVGADVSILSSHLFYGFSITQWAWAEEPFKVVWALRSDGILLSFTFIKEQELLAWAHSDTAGLFTTVATVNESTAIGNVDAVYVGTSRSINGTAVAYIERMVELYYPNGYKSSWQVDAGIGYNGAPATTFSGATHLAGTPVTGVADGKVINFTMPTNGVFVFGAGGTAGLTGIPSASIVTVGLQFLPQLQTLALDLGGEPTVQSKRKKVSAVTTRVVNTLGLSAGKTLASVQPMKDLIIGNIGTMSNALISDLQTTDARIILDPYWDVFGQYFITQPNPYPASILGVIPEIEVGDTK